MSSIPKININNQDIRSNNIYELKDSFTVQQARAITTDNGLDEVYFKANGKNYLAVGETLNLSNLKGNIPATGIFDDGNKQTEIEILHIDDEITSISEGWKKGNTLGEKLSNSFLGAVNSPVYETINSVTKPSAIFKLPESESKISVFFSNVYSGNIEDAKNDPNNPDRQMAKFIDSANSTIDLALFELDSEIITDAIIRAKEERNVQVRVVTDNDYIDEESIIRLKEHGIEVKDDQRSGLMHNKFIVADGNKVWTGSFNATDNGAWKNNNNALTIESKELAENYQREFDEMFVRNEFGVSSTSDTPHREIKVGNTEIKNFFASEDAVSQAIIDELKTASESIKFMAFSFTHDEIGNTLLEKSGKGVKVEGVFENRGATTKYSEYGRLKDADIDVRVDGNKYVMHHKVFIIDDETVITGSFNFSQNAEKTNDENLLIIKDKKIADLYLNEYSKVYAQGTVK